MQIAPYKALDISAAQHMGAHMKYLSFNAHTTASWVTALEAASGSSLKALYNPNQYIAKQKELSGKPLWIYKTLFAIQVLI